MHIALTKKLASAIGMKPLVAAGETNPLLSWTANWTKVWDNRRADDLLIMVNNATRFAVAVYEFKRKDLKRDLPQMMTAAIRNTLLALNLNPAIVDEYMRLAGDVEFVANSNRQHTAWVNCAGQDCSVHIAHTYNGIDKMFCDTVAARVNDGPVNFSRKLEDSFVPKEKFFDALSALTGLPVYSYRAYELSVTLDLDIYKATRRLIVPANIELSTLHDTLQAAFHWRDRHLHDWTVYDDKGHESVARLVMCDEDLAYDERAILETGHTLLEYLPKNKYILYTYDLGDNWEHLIELVRVIDAHDSESPYLLEAEGQSPPEDVGGAGGYIHFRRIMLDPNHEDYAETKEWVGYWTPELSEWERRPHVIHGWWW